MAQQHQKVSQYTFAQLCQSVEEQHQHHLQPSLNMVQLPRSSEHPPSCSNAGTQNPPPLGSHLPPDLPSSIEVAPKASTPLIDGAEGDQLQGQVKSNVVVVQEEESGVEQEVNVYEIEVFLKIISSSTWIFKWFTTTHI